MFDELQPEDVFAETDAAAPQMAPPTQGQTSPVLQQPAIVTSPQTGSSSTQPAVQPLMDSGGSPKKSFPFKLIALVVAIIGVIALAFFLSMKILNSKTPVTPEEPTETEEVSSNPSKDTQNEVAPPVLQETAPETNPTPTLDVNADEDKDGLTDVREMEFKTNKQNPDSDADGLFDKEEVDVYKTNPLNPDSDADTYKDGDEVKKGYNPNGAGKLLEIPK